MTKRKITIYVGMALTDAPPEFRDFFQSELKAELRKFDDVEVFDFVGLENGTAVDVYLHDRHCTETSDMCVFIVDHASTGLGIEVVFRVLTKKPCLFFAAEGRRVTRMLLGLLESKSHPLYRYNSVADIIEVVRMSLLNQKLGI